MAKKIVGLLNVYKTGFLQANKVKVTYDRHVAGLQAIADSLGIKSKGKGKNLKEKAKAEMKAQLKKLADEIVDNMGAAVAESVSEQLNKEISEEWATLGMPFGISPLFKHLDKFVLKISKGACKKGFDATTKAMGVTDADADEGEKVSAKAAAADLGKDVASEIASECIRVATDAMSEIVNPEIIKELVQGVKDAKDAGENREQHRSNNDSCFLFPSSLFFYYFL